MEKAEQKRTVYFYIALLGLGFLGLCMPYFLHINYIGGFSTALWILAFLYLTVHFSFRKNVLITCAVFLVGYCLRFLNTMGFSLTYIVVFLFMGLVQFSIFYLYSRLIRRWNRFYVTLAFPLLWLAVYFLAILVRFPTMIRVDNMFADMIVMLQAESLLGSLGLSFILLWIFSLFTYAVEKRKTGPALLGVLLYCILVTIGAMFLYPNVVESESVKVALATGPYVGGYDDFTTLPLETYLDSMRSCVEDAAKQGAEIIVFNEETYEFDDTEEEGFLEECSRSARENRIHMLVGLDLKDTDGSQGGKSQNKAVWIDQNGEILGSYRKTKTIPILESDYERGDDEIPSFMITVGDREIKVSYVICYDSNFPLFVNDIDDDTDILFLPSWDWAGITEHHARLCRTLAVENGVSVVKPTYDGINIAVRPDGMILDSFSTDEVGYEQVRIVDVPTWGTTPAIAENPEKDNYIYSIYSVEIMSILVCLILLFGCVFQNHEKSPRNNLYFWTTVLCIIGLAADAVSWIFDGCERAGPILYVSTVISLSMTFILNGAFMFYISEYIRERKSISTSLPKYYMIFSIIMSVLIAVTAGTGHLFTFENGAYVEGPMYTAYIVVNLLCSVYCLFANHASMKYLSRRERFASVSYIIIPWIAACINLVFETFSYAYPAIVLSLLVMYVMIQTERQNKLEKEGSGSYRSARLDAMTGLHNRLAYVERMKELSQAEGTVGVIFSDVNGLKFTNDTFGHDAGDRLLIRYALQMKRCFRKEDIFRISGDEFIVLMGDADEDAVLARMEEFRKLLNADKIPLACAGLAFGKSSDIGELIKTAESEMYKEKEEFYKKHPKVGKR
ncbi:MAG: diguanylate cyclase [Eubacteriales bacterium]|nr:diguanylate cyclase [Eubacteriales bacterium]